MVYDCIHTVGQEGPNISAIFPLKSLHIRLQQHTQCFPISVSKMIAVTILATYFLTLNHVPLNAKIKCQGTMKVEKV